jgi:steroid delta-isomerase-like uncharacterized protein
VIAATTRYEGEDMTAPTESATAKDIVLASIQGAIERDPDRIVEHGHPEDYVDDFVAIGEFRGRDAVRDFFAEMFTAFPDFELTVERVVAEGDAVVVKWHAAATFTGGRFQGIEPTRARVLIRGCDFFEIEDGSIRRNTVFYDGTSFAREIGMLPVKDSPADRAMLRLFNAKVRLTRPFRHRRDTR